MNVLVIGTSTSSSKISTAPAPPNLVQDELSPQTSEFNPVSSIESTRTEQEQLENALASSSLSTNILTAPTAVIGTDPAEWVINDSTIDFLLSNEINQNLDEDFSQTKTFYTKIKKFRSLTRGMFQKKMKNGKMIERKYLCYSASKKAVYCIPCRLFGEGNSKLGTEGYKDWSNAHQGLDSHEKSSEHIKSCKHFSAPSKITGRVDTELQM